MFFLIRSLMDTANGSKRQQSENSHYNDIHAKTTSFFGRYFLV